MLIRTVDAEVASILSIFILITELILHSSFIVLCRPRVLKCGFIMFVSSFNCVASSKQQVIQISFDLTFKLVECSL